MDSSKLFIEKDFGFLLNMEFTFENVQEKPSQFGSATLISKDKTIFVHFIGEYDSISILFQSVFVIRKYSSFDLFYIIKIIKKEIEFKEIGKINKTDFMQQNMDAIIKLFNKENIFETVKKIAAEEKKYNTIRWKLVP